MTGQGNSPGQSAPRRHPMPGSAYAANANLVLLSHVGPVGVALAVRLLEAGHAVFGRDVIEGCQRPFQSAGGIVSSGASQTSNVAWSIECHERPGVRPEILSWLTEHRYGYGRPRLELGGARQSVEGFGVSAGTLNIRAGRDRRQSASLQVTLDVNPRGLQLVVRGERPLFEAALPLLTVLADRVLYAGNDQRPLPA